jgi:hypothetical protein
MEVVFKPPIVKRFTARPRPSPSPKLHIILECPHEVGVQEISVPIRREPLESKLEPMTVISAPPEVDNGE